MNKPPSNDILRFIRYEKDTGKLYWNARNTEDFNTTKYPADKMRDSWNTKFADKEAFTAVGSHGYHTGAIKGKLYLLHRVAWFIEEGYWPNIVDHINGIRTDNRWVNLREVTCRESSKNIGLRSNNKSGQHGVSWRKDTAKWTSRITNDGKVILLGDYEDLDKAIKVRKEAEVTYGYHKNHGRTIE